VTGTMVGGAQPRKPALGCKPNRTQGAQPRKVAL
jgi:hypothetical protein